MAAQANIETSIRDTVNAGLGLFKAVEEKVNEIKTQAEKSYLELVQKGALDQRAEVVKVRSLLDQGLAQVKDVQTKVEGLFKNN